MEENIVINQNDSNNALNPPTNQHYLISYVHFTKYFVNSFDTPTSAYLLQ